MHHQRLHPDHRDVAAVHAAPQLDAALGLLRNPCSPRYCVLVGQLQRRHLFRKTSVQRLGRNPDRVHIRAGNCSYDPAHLDQTENPCVDLAVAPRSVLIQQRLLRQSSSQEYDRIRSLVRHHHRLLHYILAHVYQRLLANRRQGHRAAHRRNIGILLLVGRLVATGRLVVLGVHRQVIVLE